MSIHKSLVRFVLGWQISHAKVKRDRLDEYLDAMMPLPGMPAYGEIAARLAWWDSKLTGLTQRLAACGEADHIPHYTPTAT